MPTTLGQNAWFVQDFFLSHFSESVTKAVEKAIHAKHEQESKPTPRKKRRITEDAQDSEEESEDDVEMPSVIAPTKNEGVPMLGLVDRPHILWTKLNVYYLWWKSPFRVYHFSVYQLFCCF